MCCSNVARCSQKPMESGDFDKVEQQLMSQLQSVTTRGLHTLQGWSSAPLGQWKSITIIWLCPLTIKNCEIESKLKEIVQNLSFWSSDIHFMSAQPLLSHCTQKMGIKLQAPGLQRESKFLYLHTSFQLLQLPTYVPATSHV